MLKLYASKKLDAGVQWNTDFCTAATEITETNQYDFFRCDHTAILFKDGKRAKKNFVHATAIIIDVDNKGVDVPEHWVTPASISDRLEMLGIAHAVATSRNHELQKDMESPKPRFHVYFPLSEPCNLEMYEKMTGYAIETFDGDPATKDAARQFFGYGSNQHALVYQHTGIKTFDKYYNQHTADAGTKPKPDTTGNTNNPHKRTSSIGIHPADAFNEEGRTFIKQFLENRGWKYICQNSVNEHWQRPGKNHPKQHSATLKLDAPLFHVFTSSCPPLENRRAYNFFQLYAILEHGGNFAAATKELAKQGYGDAFSTEPVELNEFIDASPGEENEDDEESDSDCSETFPAHLLNVPGFVNDFAQYVNSVPHVDQPTYSLAAALAFQALLCAQNVKDPTGIRTNPYIIVAGRSSSGKDKGREIIKKVFTQLVNTPKTKLERHYKPLHHFIESVASYQALVKWLKRNHGVLLWLWDELGKELASWAKDRSANLSGVKTELMRLERIKNCFGVFCILRA